MARGARRADTVEEAVLASPLTLVCLLDYGASDAVLRPAAGALRGRTLVNLTNGTPAQAREAETWAIGQGASYLDGGIMAVPSTVATSQAFVLFSGQRRHFDAHEETLKALGAAKYLFEPGVGIRMATRTTDDTGPGRERRLSGRQGTGLLRPLLAGPHRAPRRRPRHGLLRPGGLVARRLGGPGRQQRQGLRQRRLAGRRHTRPQPV
ncbi:hypothetical protein GCM10009730_65320 [Streptomyces albidochromogenes]